MHQQDGYPACFNCEIVDLGEFSMTWNLRIVATIFVFSSIHGQAMDIATDLNWHHYKGIT